MKNLLLSIAFILPTSTVSAQEPARSPIDVKRVVTIESTAKDAYLWGYPLVRFERTRKLMTTTPGFGHAPLNTFFHAQQLFQPQDRGMINPIPDTLYSSAFLDLRSQPMVLEIPKIKDRFYSLHFMDALTNSIGVVSSRTRGETAGRFFITGPNYIGPTPAGFEHISSSTNFAWVVGHIATDSPAQVRKSYNILRKYRLRSYNAYLGKEKRTPASVFPAQPASIPDPRNIANAGVGFFDELGVALRENEPANLDMALTSKFRAANIGVGIRTSQPPIPREIQDAYTRAIAAAEMEINRTAKSDLVVNRNGWNYILPRNRQANNSALRAALSKIYFGGTTPLESLHPVAYVDDRNSRLNGNSTYIIHFSRGKLPPVGAFWSIVPYDARNKNLVANGLRRYSLGSYSPELNYNRDGSLDIYLSANEPKGRSQNWLPVPRGSFYVMMNMYNPTDAVIGGSYVLPRIQKTTATQSISLNR